MYTVPLYSIHIILVIQSVHVSHTCSMEMDASVHTYSGMLAVYRNSHFIHT